MALTKQIKIDKIEIIGDFKIIQVREVVQIIENGNILASSFHRSSYAPNVDIAKAPEEVQQAAASFWTDEVKTAYKSHLSAK